MIEEEDLGLTFSDEDFDRRYSSEGASAAAGPSRPVAPATKPPACPDRPQPQQVHAHSSAPPPGRLRPHLGLVLDQPFYQSIDLAGFFHVRQVSGLLEDVNRKA